MPTEEIHKYLLAVCNPLSDAVAEKIGLSSNGRDQLMDERRKDTRQYLLIAVSSLDGQILTHSIVSEMGARNTEGPHFKAIINH